MSVRFNFSWCSGNKNFVSVLYCNQSAPRPEHHIRRKKGGRKREARLQHKALPSPSDFAFHFSGSLAQRWDSGEGLLSQPNILLHPLVRQEEGVFPDAPCRAQGTTDAHPPSPAGCLPQESPSPFPQPVYSLQLPLSNVLSLKKSYLHFLPVASRTKYMAFLVFPLKMLIQPVAYFSWLRSKPLRSPTDWL